MDKKYFLRSKHDIRLTLDSFYFQLDYVFTTSNDYKVAQILAHKPLEKYLASKLKKHQKQEAKNPNQTHNISPLKWTGSKVALVELMYALHTEGVLNNGNLSLNETAKNMESKNNIAISMTENGDTCENALAERMNGIIKPKFNLYSSILGFEQTRNKISKSIKSYNELRPHASCDYLTPNQAHLQSDKLNKR